MSKRILLFPGLGADGRLFSKLEIAHEVPSWIPPSKGESLTHYARRLAESIKTSPNEKLILAGQSFGGQVALELARHLPTSAVALIASGNDKSVITSQFRLQQKLMGHLGETVIKSMMRNIAIPFFKTREGLSDSDVECLRDMTESLDLAFFTWASKSVLDWDFKLSEIQAPVHHIHGAKDYVIPRPKAENLLLIDDGCHLINFTHAKEVSDWLKKLATN